ncbi:unnamed protein product [Protopolystoma xenopodis]|uniref:Uncharacterized protein n=1 Tax=Protopolystoma xenopodis TaxID=117903 RepID=A0A448WZ39_9PLAT|nr:unnamed protein product [Protopolystoma xenopodis]
MHTCSRNSTSLPSLQRLSPSLGPSNESLRPGLTGRCLTRGHHLIARATGFWVAEFAKFCLLWLRSSVSVIRSSSGEDDFSNGKELSEDLECHLWPIIDTIYSHTDPSSVCVVSAGEVGPGNQRMGRRVQR